MAVVSDRDLIVAAIDTLERIGPAATGALSWRLREAGLAHRASRLKDLLCEAAGLGVVRLQPRTPGVRSRRWELGEVPLPGTFAVYVATADETTEPAPPPDLAAMQRDLINALGLMSDRLQRIEARLEMMAGDYADRPLFARRNGR